MLSVTISVHASNIPVILVTLEVLKLVKSNEVKLSQPLNIYDISITDEVSKFETSIDFNDSQFSNILFIFSTFEVLSIDIFNFSKEVQESNIFDKSVTSDILNFINSISTILDNPEKSPFKLV